MREIVAISDQNWQKTTIFEALNQDKTSVEFSKSKTAKTVRVRYGQRIVRGQLVPHQEEQKVIKKIITLHKSGKSQRQIAKTLNEKGIKSKKGGLWEKSVVAVIIKRTEQEQVNEGSY